MERKHQDVVQRVDILINGIKKIIKVCKENQRKIDEILEEWERDKEQREVASNEV